MNFPNGSTQPPDNVGEFLDLTVMKLLLGEDITSCKEWLEKYQTRAPITGRPETEFFRLTRLAAVEELFKESGKVNAQKAFELLPVVAGEYMFDSVAALILQKAVSLSMLLENDEATKHWRKKRLEMPVFENWETSSFELLYLSSDLAQADKFESKVTAVSRVCVSTFELRSLDSIAPLVLSLAAYCHKKDKNLADALKGRVIELEQDVFSDSSPKIEIDNQQLKYKTIDDEPVLQIAASARGNGNLSTGSYEIEPFTTRLAPTLVKEYKRAEKNQAVKATLNNEDGLIECYLKLDSGVDMSSDEISNLERRMKVGFEWASCLTKEIKAKITLNVK
ncbi:MAG: hypothetical protein WA584_09380 [Pyrinomonadaceae bacterium]